MGNNFQDFNGFPTDNSSTTNLKYDIIASKLAKGFENHQRRSVPVNIVAGLGLVGTMLQVIVGIIILFVFGMKWIFKGK